MIKANINVEELIYDIFEQLEYEDANYIIVNLLASFSNKEQIEIFSQAANSKQVLQQALEAYDRKRTNLVSKK